MIFSDTLAYKAAIAIQKPVEAVYEDMNSDFSRAESKRKWVESLVSLSASEKLFIANFRHFLALRSFIAMNLPVG